MEISLLIFSRLCQVKDIIIPAAIGGLCRKCRNRFSSYLQFCNNLYTDRRHIGYRILKICISRSDQCQGIKVIIAIGFPVGIYTGFHRQDHSHTKIKIKAAGTHTALLRSCTFLCLFCCFFALIQIFLWSRCLFLVLIIFIIIDVIIISIVAHKAFHILTDIIPSAHAFSLILGTML